MTRQAGIWWFDMQGGWYDDPKILALFRRMRGFGETNDSPWRPQTEVAVFVDDKSSYRLRPEEPFLHDRVTGFLAEMPRFGAPYDTYILSDIARGPEYKLYIFPLAFDLTDQERAAINALKHAGKTLVFFGEAGIGRYHQGRVEHDPKLAEALAGGPSTSPSEGRRVWKWAERPTLAELRDVARRAGVHLYHEEDDALYAGNGLIALHAQHEGTKTLRFPEEVHVTELFSSTPLEATGRELTFLLKAKETRCFAVR